MKVLFVYPNINKAYQTCMGIAYLSSYLKAAGIETFLWDNTFDSLVDLLDMIQTIKFDFVCFTSLSPDYIFLKNLLHLIKISPQ